MSVNVFAHKKCVIRYLRKIPVSFMYILALRLWGLITLHLSHDALKLYVPTSELSKTFRAKERLNMFSEGKKGRILMKRREIYEAAYLIHKRKKKKMYR